MHLKKKKIVYGHFNFFFFFKFLRKSTSQIIQTRKKKERKRPKKKMTIHVHFAYWFFHPHRWEAFFYLVFSSIWRENILVGLERKHPHSTNFPSFLLSNQTPTKMIFSPSFFIPLKSL